MGFERNSSVKKESKIEYENLTEGEHEARLIYVADCGMQLREYKGEVKSPAQQIALCFEVLGSTITVDGVEQPRIIWSKPFNIFGRMSGLSTEFEMFKAFVPTAQEETVADWESVLGKPVNIIVKHFKKDADTTYDNVDAPAIRNLFGLAKFIHDKRISSTKNIPTATEARPVSEVETFDDEVPF